MVKTGSDKMTMMLMLAIFQGVIGLVVIPFRPLPEAHHWPWLLGSGVFHTGYMLFLGYAYQRGDLSRVYPIARGAAPLMVLLFSIAFLSDTLNSAELWGICVLGLGIMLMAHGVFRHAEDVRLIPLALGSAFCTAGYSVVDGLGARVMGDAVAYLSWLFVLSAVSFSLIAYAKEGRASFAVPPSVWGFGSLVALAAYIAYVIVVWAMTQAPIALVTALRESSILFAMLLGWIFFRDKMDRFKIAAAVLIVSGVILTRF